MEFLKAKILQLSEQTGLPQDIEEPAEEATAEKDIEDECADSGDVTEENEA